MAKVTTERVRYNQSAYAAVRLKALTGSKNRLSQNEQLKMSCSVQI